MAKTTIAAKAQIWWVQSYAKEDVYSSKIKKIRPWIVISPNKWNYYSSAYVMLPITHNGFQNMNYKVEIDCPTKPGAAFNKSYVACYIPRTVDEHELISYIGSADNDIVKECIKALNRFLEEDENYNDEELFDEDFEDFELCNKISSLEDNNEKEEDDYTEYDDENTDDTLKEIEVDITYENEAYPDFRKYYKPKFYKKYCHIESSLEINDIIQSYYDNPNKFRKEYKVTKRDGKELINELKNYYRFIIEHIVSGSL